MKNFSSRLSGIITAFILLQIVISAQAQVGYIDTAYYANMGFDNAVIGSLVQPDSSVIVYGNFTRCNERIIGRMAKLKPDGSNDYTFSLGGVGFDGQVNMVLRQADGKLIVGGSFGHFNGISNRLIRLNGNGSLDTSFSQTTLNNPIYTGAVLSSGKILVGGIFSTSGPVDILRLNTNGSIDTSFHSGTTGMAGNSVFSLSVLSNGEVLVAGNNLALLKANGTRDSSFAITANSVSQSFYTTGIQTSGKIIVGGNFTSLNGISHIGIARFNTNGTLDTTFLTGTGFSNVTVGTGSVRTLLVQSGDAILAGGSFTGYNGYATGQIIRLNANGTRDTTFNPGTGTNGNYATPVYGVNADSAGNIFIAGVFSTVNAYSRLCLVKLQSNGTLSQTFFYTSGLNGSVTATAVQSTGKVIVGGNFTRYNDISCPAIARLNTDGSLDTSFHAGTGFNGAINVITVLSNNKLLVGGNFTSFNGTTVHYIVQLNTDGSLDGSFTLPAFTSQVYDIQVPASGIIYAAGGYSTGHGLARFSSSGTYDVSYPSSTVNASVKKLIFQPDSKLLLLCNNYLCGAGCQNIVLRLDTLGHIDSTFAITNINSYMSQAFTMALGANGKVTVSGLGTPVRLKTNGTIDSFFTSALTFTTVNCLLPYNNGVICAGSGLGGNFAVLDSTGALTTTSFYTGSQALTISGGLATLNSLVFDTINNRVLVGGVNQTVFEGSIAPYFAGLIYKPTNTALDSITPPAPLCANATAQVKFKNEDVFNTGNVFTVQLSDTGGSFTSPTSIGTLSSSAVKGWDSITITIPSGALSSSHYKMRVTSTNPIYTSAASGYLSIKPNTDTITHTTPLTFCSGGSVTLSSQTQSSYTWGTSATTQSITATTSGTYTLTVSSNGCSATASVSVSAVSISAPTTPAAQTVCSDTAYIFTLHDTACTCSHQIEWALDDSFATAITVTSPAAIAITVNPGATDTIYLRSRDSLSNTVSSAVTTILKVNYKPAPPTPPAPVSVNSDTAYTFNFVNLNPGLHGNQLAWALDSNFTTTNLMACFDTTLSGKDTSSCSISVKVSPNSDTLIWLKSIDTTTGCASNATTTIGIVTHIYQRGTINLDTIITVCTGSTATIPIAHSHDSLLYKLRIDTAVISSSRGNGATLYLNTDTITGSTIFNILTTDTATGDTATLGFGILVQALAPVDSNVMMEGDTFVFVDDTVCYVASANNGIKTIYSLLSGDATIDSLLGCVTNIDSNYVVQATLYGPPGCGTATGTIAVTTTIIAAPAAPAPITAYIDSPTQVTTIVFSSIHAGIGADEIEWATNKNFTGSTIVSAPANISITIPGLGDTTLWLRSVDGKTGNHSRIVKALASTALPTLCAGLLDKTNWVLDTLNSDEFNYAFGAPGNPSMVYPDEFYMTTFHPEFLNKWNLIFQWAPGHADYTSAGNYWLAGDGGGSANVADWGESPQNPNPCHTGHGCGHEVGFTSSGAALFKATKLDSVHHLTSTFFNYTSDTTGYWDTMRMAASYQTGMLMSSHGFPLTNSMCEFRAILPSNNSAGKTDQRSAFWNYTGNGDYTTVDGGNSTKVNSAVGDDMAGGCNQQMVKITPCNYDEDWHTYTVVSTPTEIIHFIDGKETWSTKFSNVYAVNQRWPEDIFNGSTANSPVIMGIGAAVDSGVVPDSSYIDTYQLQVDYFRYYTAKNTLDTTNPAAQILQNLGTGGVAQTLETLDNPDSSAIKPANTPSQNNNVLAIANNNGGPTHVVADSKIAYTNEPGLQKIYYAGTDGKCYNAYYQSGQWYEYPLVSWVTDVQGGITVNKDRVYYTSKTGELKFFQWISNQNQWVNYGAGVQAVSLNVDNLGRVFYINSDSGGVYAWCPTDAIHGTVVPVVTDSTAWAGLVVHSCGCLLFYEDKFGGLRQHSWWNIWRSQGTVFGSAVSANMKIDEMHSRLFFTGSDYDIHSYAWDYNLPNPAGFKKLGFTTCSNNAFPLSYLDAPDYDAQGMIAFSNNNNIVYYSAQDGNIWYYYNDNDHGTNTYPVNVNWYKSPVSYGGSSILPGHGYLAVEPTGNGRLFYLGGDNEIHLVDWENADNPSDCPRKAFNHDTGDAAAKMYYITDTAASFIDSTNGLSVTVFPNPSKETFNFNILSNSTSNVDVKIYDINGTIVSDMNSIIQSGVAQNLIWDAKNMCSGIYYYRVKTDNGYIATNKLVKM